MKQFLKNYGMLWIKFLALAPAFVLTKLSLVIVYVYSLAAAALLGDGKTFNQIYEDSLYD